MKSKVLLIDDSVTIHRVIDLSIDFDRYDIVKVFSKEDAALKLQSEQFDYILLDNKLDNIIISEYIAELKQQQKSATIILLVGAFDRFDESDLEKTKADDYLVKPFDSQSLNEKLSSEADMMPAGIVERIAEADFARDNDDYVQKSDIEDITEHGSNNEVITKEEYLDNLEEVALDDLTDKGYIEDFDQTETAEKAGTDFAENKVQETVLENTEVLDELNTESENQPQVIQEVNNDADLTAVNNMVSIHDLDEDEDNEDDGNYKDDDMPLSSIDVEEPLTVSKSSELEESQSDIFNQSIDEAVNEAPQVDDFSATEEVSQMASFTDEEESQKDIQETEPSLIEEPIENFSLQQQENDDVSHPDEHYIEMPDPIKTVRNPILPGIDDAAAISDEYLMQENLTRADNGGADMLHEFPDFPEIDEQEEKNIENNEAELPVTVNEENTYEQEQEEETVLPVVEDIQEEENVELPVIEDEAVSEDIPVAFDDAENNEETLSKSEQIEEVVEEKEVPLFEDDDWLSDAPVTEKVSEESINEEQVADNEPSFDFASDINTETAEDEPLFTDDNNIHVSEEQIIDEQAESEEIISEEPVSADFEEPNFMQEQSEDAKEVSSEEIVQEMNLFEEEKQVNNFQEESTVDDNVLEENNQVEEDLQSNEELQAEENKQEEVHNESIVAPVVNAVENKAGAQEVKQAEAYKEETSGRFGGITVTISRDEIMSMLGNAIDKYFLEEAVKEVIAANMKDIVRNIVPAIAEKYIKEEIERLKNDE